MAVPKKSLCPECGSALYYDGYCDFCQYDSYEDEDTESYEPLEDNDTDED